MLIVIAPAVDPPRATSRDDLPEQLARLTEAERSVLRLKALVGVATNKSDFLSMANASAIAGPGGASLTSNTLNPVLNRLLSLGLLNADFACVESLRHPLAIEMIAAPEGCKAAEAVRRIFPAASYRSGYYSYAPQTDPARASDCDWRSTKTTATPSASPSPPMTKPTAPRWVRIFWRTCSRTPSWTCPGSPGRDLDIQFRLFWVKLTRLMSMGRATADTPALFAHYRDREDTPGYAEFKWALLRGRYSGRRPRRREAENPLDAGGVAGNRAVQPPSSAWGR